MNRINKIVISGMFFAMGMVLPFFTGEIPVIGKMLLPMHIPVFLCGLIAGWQYGMLVGGLLPLVRSLLFGMPVFYPTAVAMTFELAAYGFVSGWIYSHSKWQCTRMLYRSIIAAMVIGRGVLAAAQIVLMGIGKNTFVWSVFITEAFINGIPGIVIQLTLIPGIMISLNSAKIVPFHQRSYRKDRWKARNEHR